MSKKIEALTKLADRLNELDRVFKFIPYTENGEYVEEDSNWWLRVPKPEDNEGNDEDVQILHSCDPVKFWECIENKDPERTVAVSGYVAEGKCLRCSKPVDEKIEKRLVRIQKLAHAGSGLR